MAETKAAAAAKAKAAKEKSVEETEVTEVEDVLQPTGEEAGGLKKSKVTEAKSERDANADAAPFAGTAVAGSQTKTFNQSSQLYTDGLGGEADHNLDRAYGG